MHLWEQIKERSVWLLTAPQSAHCDVDRLKGDKTDAAFGEKEPADDAIGNHVDEISVLWLELGRFLGF